jgi:hypothetical protein
MAFDIVALASDTAFGTAVWAFDTPDKPDTKCTVDYRYMTEALVDYQYMVAEHSLV